MTTQNHKNTHSIRQILQRRRTETMRRIRFNFFSLVVFVCAAALMFWSVQIYQRTFIDWHILVLPVITGSFLGALFSWKIFWKHQYTAWAIIWIGIAMGSAVPLFTFLYGNERLANERLVTQPFKIVSTGRLLPLRYSCGKPFAVIDFYGFHKQLLFNCEDIKNMKQYTTVSVTYSLGLFGYKVIRQQTLEK